MVEIIIAALVALILGGAAGFSFSVMLLRENIMK